MTVWSHNVVVWLLLKIGVIGLAGFLLLFVALAPGVVRGGLDATGAGAATALLVLLAVSQAINRVASPEGMFLLAALLVLILEAPASKGPERENRLPELLRP